MEIKKADYIYQDGTEALKNINLNIKDNAITVIIGNSGSGKTTLLNLLAREFSNTIKLSYMLQNPNEQFFQKSVKEELGYQLEAHEYRMSEKDKRIKDALIMVGLDPSISNMNPFKLTNSSKRLLSFADALITNPHLLLLDEPSATLTDVEKVKMIRLIKMLKNRYHRTIVIATNDTNFALKIADDIIVLKKGKVVMQGDKYEVFKDSKRTKKNMIQEPNIIAFENIVYEKKKIKLGYRDDINDLIKDIYRARKW